MSPDGWPLGGGQRVAVASAPFRVSLAGGGTDLPSYSRRFGGTVVSFAIDRRVRVLVRDAGNDPEGGEMAEGPPGWTSHEELVRNDLARAAMQRVGSGSMRLACRSDAPARSGLGGSGAFLVALVLGLRASSSPPEPTRLAEEASRIEMTDLRRTVGKHDHYISALGGLRVLRISPDGAVAAEALPISQRFATYVRERLLLFHTGRDRDADAILRSQDRETRSANADTLRRLRAIHDLAPTMIEVLAADRVDEIGPLLDQHWRYKTGLSDLVAGPRVEELYALALESGADGGKLLGAGGGGFMLVSCLPGQQARLRGAMAQAGATELKFSASSRGARLRRATAPASEGLAGGISR